MNRILIIAAVLMQPRKTWRIFHIYMTPQQPLWVVKLSHALLCDLCCLPRVNRLGKQQTPRVNNADAPGHTRLD